MLLGDSSRTRVTFHRGDHLPITRPRQSRTVEYAAYRAKGPKVLITADWVLPISRPPIRNGAVIVRHGTITEVGTVEELGGLAPGTSRHDHPGCVIVPGLVNAHTHLSLTAVGGLLAPAPFEQWLPRLVTATKKWGVDDHAASASLGAHRCLQSGVTVVGDITYGPEAPSAALTAGLGGTFFWEILGVPSPALYAELEKREFPTEPEGACGPRMRCGLSPHSPYTSGPRLLAAMHEAAGELRCPFAIHAAESGAEVELLRSGTGPLAPVAERNADGFRAPGCSPITYLDDLGVLDGATIVHAGHAGPSDVVRLAATARGVVACPRSNEFLHNPVAPVSRMLRAGIPVGLGTDSAASNHDLDLMAEARALRSMDASIPASRLLEMVTTMGAIALGLEDRFGLLERGMRADLAVFRLGETSDPVGATIDRAGADTVEAVLSDGVWRILEGEATEDVRAVELAAQAARVRAEHALSLP